jgi:hypothetical protein
VVKLGYMIAGISALRCGGIIGFVGVLRRRSFVAGRFGIARREQGTYRNCRTGGALT